MKIEGKIIQYLDNNIKIVEVEGRKFLVAKNETNKEITSALIVGGIGEVLTLQFGDIEKEVRFDIANKWGKIQLKKIAMKEMKTYQKKGFEYFYDRIQKLWVIYPIDSDGNRIEWDTNDNPIEAQYANNKEELNTFLNNQ